MGACGSKHHPHSHHSAVVLDTESGDRKPILKNSADIESPTFKASAVESDSDSTPETVRRTSSDHFKPLVNSALSAYESYEKEKIIQAVSEVLGATDLSDDVVEQLPSIPKDKEQLTAAQAYQKERKERIRKRLEEVKAQVTEGHRRIEALKKSSQHSTEISGAAESKKTSEKKASQAQQLRDALLPPKIPPTPLCTPQPSFRKSQSKPKEIGTAVEWNHYARGQSFHSRMDETADRSPTCIRQVEQDEDVFSLGASELNLKYDSVMDMRNLSADIVDSDKEEDILPPKPLSGRKSSWLRDISDVVDYEPLKKGKPKLLMPHPTDEEPPSFSSTTIESGDTLSTTEPQQKKFLAAKDSLHQRRSISLTPREPIHFQDIEDTKFRRNALKLFKRLNPHDPWDISHRYKDDELFEFVEEHPEVAAVRYDFQHFSGHIFPLSVLCTLGASLETIQLVYKSFPKAIDECDVWIGTPLHYAMQHKAKSAVVSFLISQHPSMLQECNQFGRLPLHMASLFRATSKTVSLLLEEYLEAADQVEKDGYTPLHLACENGSSAEVVKLLIDGKVERCMARIPTDASTPLHLACAKNANKAVVAELLSVGIEALECFDANGCAPLHLAIKFQASWDVIQCIVNAKPDIVDLKTSQGYTVLSMAKKADASPQIMRLLMQD